MESIFKAGEVELDYKRYVQPEAMFQLRTSKSTYQYLWNHYNPNKTGHREFFYAVFLDQSMNAIGLSLIGTGGINHVLVDIRLVAQAALLLNATGVMISHNHPSGKVQPSPEDVNLTKKLSEGLQTLQIRLFDHIIVSNVEDGRYYSFSDEGLI